MSVVGPGAVQDTGIAPTPMLDGVTEFEYITLLNPLSDDFAVRVAQDIPVNLPFNIGRDMSGKTSQTTLTERDAATTYGLSLKNPDFIGRKHIVNDTIIRAGHTINLKGNEAQVAIRQLVNEILQREGKQRLMADPALRHEVEQRIIVSRGSIQELMDSNLRTPRNQIDDAISKSNEVQDEPGFSNETVSQASAGSDDSGAEGATQERRGPGRPKKA
jgi:hypothetical protein